MPRAPRAPPALRGPRPHRRRRLRVRGRHARRRRSAARARASRRSSRAERPVGRRPGGAACRSRADPALAGVAVALLRELLFRLRDRAGEVPVGGRGAPRSDRAGAEATVAFARYDPERHAEGADVKAVTWHAARLEREPADGGWRRADRSLGGGTEGSLPATDRGRPVGDPARGPDEGAGARLLGGTARRPTIPRSQQVVERRAPPGHPPVLARDAGHPLGVRVPHRRRRGGRRGATARSRPGGVGYDINCGVRVVTTAPRGGRASGRALHARRRAALPRHPDRRRREPPRSRASATPSSTRCSRTARAGRCGAASPRRPTTRSAARRAAGSPAPTRPPSSARARQRGADQVGHARQRATTSSRWTGSRRSTTRAAAEAFGLVPGAVALQIHSGSRGLGYQVCDEFARRARAAARRLRARLRGAPGPAARLRAGRRAPRAGAYLGAMQAAANFAWANRQVMTGLAVRALLHALRISERELGARAPLRRLPQRREAARSTSVDGERRATSSCTARARRAASGPATRACPRPTARSGSRCSSPATWGATPTSSPGRRRR